MYFILFILIILVIFLTIKICLLKKSAEEIRIQLAEKLSDDTNTSLCISSSDKDMRKLADELNIQLKELRKQKNMYIQGDSELKNAVTNISHDLRTPLTAISSYIELMESNPEKSEQYISVIKERTEALAQLTEELFRYSIVISPEQDNKIEEVSVNSVLEESILGYYAALQDRGIIPEINITEKKIIRNVNRSSLSRVFTNLLNNAVKYSSGDLSVSMDDEGVIVFSNSSAELSKVQVERLFDRFYTIENARKSTGLGLSIAKMFIEQMDGTINAEYTDGCLKIRIFIPESKSSDFPALREGETHQKY